MHATLEADIPLEGVLQELSRRAEPFNLKTSEALNWMLTIPGLDDFFGQVVEMKKKTLQ